MPNKIRKKTAKHLIKLIKERINNTANFALLIGAGASASSGAKTGAQMIAEWRRQLYVEANVKESFNAWLEKQFWYKCDDEYSILFEEVYDRPSQRRDYIENCISRASPSWGYIYLANIISKNYFNVVFTPNFDDLLNEACYTFTNIKPIVCAHDSAVLGMRLTKSRPKIIKLHGDFLFDSIKNTTKETQSLEKNMKDKFMQFLREYGLIVIGYGGHDASIMSILEEMLKQDDYLPNGLYWCMKKRDFVGKRLSKFIQKKKVFLVEIEGFDEFMAELHRSIGLSLPDSLA